MGRNLPQRPPLRFDTERLSGTSFTNPRHEAQRSLLYRPLFLADQAAQRRINDGLLCGASADPIPDRLRRDPSRAAGCANRVCCRIDELLAHGEAPETGGVTVRR
jgi:homogentisate 1,2-dioxygenase